jgi:hypothetical protein
MIMLLLFFVYLKFEVESTSVSLSSSPSSPLSLPPHPSVPLPLCETLSLVEDFNAALRCDIPLPLATPVPKFDESVVHKLFEDNLKLIKC